MMRSALIVLGAVMTLLLPAAWASPPGASPYELQVAPVGQAVHTVQAWQVGGVVYVPADQLAQVVEGTYSWWSDLGKFTLFVNRTTVEIWEQSEFVTINGEPRLQLPEPAFLWESRLYVPIRLLVDNQGHGREWVGRPVTFYAEDRLLQAGARSLANLTEVHVIQDALGWKLSFVADAPFDIELLRTERASMVLRLKGVSYDPMFVVFPSEHPWFQGLRLRSTRTGVEAAFSAGVLPRGYRLIQSHDKQTNEILLGVDERDIRTGRLTAFSAPRAQGRTQLRRLVLDPGHAQDSEGGSLAYDICMALAERVSQGLDLEVLVTHARDQDPEPEVRVRRANEAGGDLLISLHLHPRPGGPTAYVGQPALPAPVERGLSRMGFRSYYSSQEGHAQMSRAVAQDLLQAVSDQLGLTPRGVFTESLPELQGALMPAVMVEFGLDERLWDEESKERVVEGLATAIRNQYWRSGP